MNTQRFHLTLPSNSSMNYYLNNTVAQFVTKLPQAIELNGDWKVALTEISFPIRLPNVLPNTCSVTVLSSINEPIATYVLEFGYYEYIRQLTCKLNKHLCRHDIALAPYVVRKKVRIDNDSEFLIQFNETLARILGFVYDISTARFTSRCT